MKSEINTATAETVQTESDQAVAPSTNCSRLPHPFLAELHPCNGWDIFTGSQYICHCGSDGQRDLLLAALNHWRGTEDEARVMARLLTKRDALEDKCQVCGSSNTGIQHSSSGSHVFCRDCLSTVRAIPSENA